MPMASQYDETRFSTADGQALRLLVSNEGGPPSLPYGGYLRTGSQMFWTHTGKAAYGVDQRFNLVRRDGLPLDSLTSFLIGPLKTDARLSDAPAAPAEAESNAPLQKFLDEAKAALIATVRKELLLTGTPTTAVALQDQLREVQALLEETLQRAERAEARATAAEASLALLHDAATTAFPWLSKTSDAAAADFDLVRRHGV